MNRRFKLTLLTITLLLLGSISSASAATCGRVDSNGDYWYQCEGSQITQTAKPTIGDYITNFSDTSTHTSWFFHDGYNNKNIFNSIVKSDLSGYDLFTAAGSPTTPISVVLTINQGVKIYSTLTSRAAIYSSQNFPSGSSLVILNKGGIFGACGAGGGGGGAYYNGSYHTYGQRGGNGGDAISLSASTTIYNFGKIYSGGGGGGGGGMGRSVTCDGINWGWGGSGGGGGVCGSIEIGVDRSGGAPGSPSSACSPSQLSGGYGGVGGSSFYGASGNSGQNGGPNYFGSNFGDSLGYQGYGGPGGSAGSPVKTNSFPACVGGSQGEIKGSISGSYTTNCTIDPSLLKPPSISLYTSPSLVNWGGYSTINWVSSNSVSCEATDGWSGTKPLSGQENIGPIKIGKIYGIDCLGYNGQIVSATTSIDFMCPNGYWESSIQNVFMGTESDTSQGCYDYDGDGYDDADPEWYCGYVDIYESQDLGRCVSINPTLYSDYGSDAYVCDGESNYLYWEIYDNDYYYVPNERLNNCRIESASNGFISSVTESSGYLLTGPSWGNDIYTLVCDGITNTSSVNFTLESPRSNVQNLKIGSLTCDSVHLSWDNVDCSQYYTLNRSDYGEYDSAYNTFYNDGYDISEGTLYQYQVKACNSNGVCTSPAVVSTTTPFCAGNNLATSSISTCLATQGSEPDNKKIYVNKQMQWKMGTTTEGVAIPLSATTTWSGTGITTERKTSFSVLDYIYTTVGLKNIYATSTWIESGISKTAFCSTTTNVILGGDSIKEI